MIITVSYWGKKIKVDVNEANCFKYKCFAPHKYRHQQRTIDGQDSGHQDKDYSCSNRNYHGCPDTKEIKEKATKKGGKNG